MLTPSDVKPPPPEEKLERPCTGRTCFGRMAGEKTSYLNNHGQRVEYIKWTCQSCGKVEI